MGGLICRCLLQKHRDLITNVAGESLVHKVFTYATPHNGIEVLGRNIAPPYFLRPVMANYLAIDPEVQRRLGGAVNTLDGKFDTRRMFCLVGTNYSDYPSVSRHGAGERSDGLVAIKNATVIGARCAYVHRCHSGPHGIVNSEEGYQNLVRFLFGKGFIDGRMQIQEVPELPDGGDVSYQAEVKIGVVGQPSVALTERKKDHWSAALRTLSEADPLDLEREINLFSFLFSQTEFESIIRLSIDIAVSATVPVRDGSLQLDDYRPNQFLFRKSMMIEIEPQSLAVSYAFDDDLAYGSKGLLPMESEALNGGGSRSSLGLAAPNGFRAALVLTLGDESENQETPEPAENKNDSDSGASSTQLVTDVEAGADSDVRPLGTPRGELHL